MSKIVCRYTMRIKEQTLWQQEDMEGWRRAFEACVEDDAREQGNKKYVIYDREGEIVAKNDVKPLPVQEPKTAAATIYDY